MKRGSFVSVKSWADVATRRAVYRDANGEYVRLFTGGILRRDDGIAGRKGVIVGSAPNHHKVVRLDNGKTVELSTEVLKQLRWDTNRMCWT